jgi:hypothetical protein
MCLASINFMKMLIETSRDIIILLYNLPEWLKKDRLFWHSHIKIINWDNHLNNSLTKFT